MLSKEPDEATVERAAKALRQSIYERHGVTRDKREDRDDARAALTAISTQEVDTVTGDCRKIFDHKWLDPNCVENGCQSLVLGSGTQGRNAVIEEAVAYARDHFRQHHDDPPYHRGPSEEQLDQMRRALASPVKAEPIHTNSDTLASGKGVIEADCQCPFCGCTAARADQSEVVGALRHLIMNPQLGGAWRRANNALAVAEGRGHLTDNLALPDKAVPTPPAQKIMNGLQDVLAFAKGDTSKARVTSPAASDLRERAEYEDRLNLFLTRITRLHGDAYVQTFRDEFAAIRAEAKAEGWEDAVKALRDNPPIDWMFGLDADSSDVADWLAANRPTEREDK